MAYCQLGEKGCWKDGKCHFSHDCENKVLTNADRIRSMSDEELSMFLCEEFDCGSESCPGIKLCKPNEGKANGLLKWLQQTAEPPKEV